jgi:hypothetical protein
MQGFLITPIGYIQIAKEQRKLVKFSDRAAAHQGDAMPFQCRSLYTRPCCLPFSPSSRLKCGASTRIIARSEFLRPVFSLLPETLHRITCLAPAWMELTLNPGELLFRKFGADPMKTPSSVESPGRDCEAQVPCWRIDLVVNLTMTCMFASMHRLEPKIRAVVR